MLVTNVQKFVLFHYHQQKPSSNNINLINLFHYFHKFRHNTFPTCKINSKTVFNNINLKTVFNNFNPNFTNSNQLNIYT
ncbi:hypothetical protein KSS87_014286 [Heliosperma pusillum]|nr:hypothetical protein KSS87_014286 [Heliosperma pusillum]